MLNGLKMIILSMVYELYQQPIDKQTFISKKILHTHCKSDLLASGQHWGYFKEMSFTG